VKPTHRGFQKDGAEMGWTLPHNRENNTRLILPGRYQRQHAAAFMERR
jgi:hypothetical protein